MKDFFKDIFEYHHHYNQQVADLLMERSGRFDSEKCILLYSHIINAHHIWNSRLLQKKPAVSVWQVHPVESSSEMDKANFIDTQRLLAELDFSSRITYLTSGGIRFDNSVQEILFHMANHTTHHRGQIMAELRRNNIEPLMTDYIFYKR